MNYREAQYKRVENIIREKYWIFNGDAGGGQYGKRNYPFILQDANNNLYKKILIGCKKYFEENEVAWWGGSLPNHTLSSQIACLNHLFMIRNDKNAVLSIIKAIDSEIIDIFPIVTDKNPAYIQFEAVSDEDHLNEKCVTRGANCTSVDALVYGVHNDGKRIIFPIEWKYTEFYHNDNKLKDKYGEGRKRRYTDLIENSKQLCATDIVVYFYEPFYQLMRQTLWAEQLIKNNETEKIKADDYIHIHVIPKENDDLLDEKYPCSNMGMEDTWRASIRNQDKYCIITPDELLKPIAYSKEYEELIEYLRNRYWE